ncbi:putative nucleotide-binding protein with TIR-like domain [Paenibacillus pabuli]|uniref:Nucleotide-binding protein with TIR-like domain n=1 Tax=Paenibacillus pabuli TaxID=1472 RepID=A0ABX9BTK2_9BACL|nr:nucleotide-binding protein [Paenibacillus pabuli]RAJ03576.1 putative nucleotide-binding protein with TIR-like domain [Paenibacillus pabuli]
MKTLKPRVFIGCSLEAKPIAAAVHENLRFSAEVTPWYSGVFNPSSYTMDDLETEVRTTDFAIFIFHPDDISKIRGKYYASVRDNTMLEMGLFMGRLGRKRIFFILPEDITDIKDATKVEGLRMPTDLLGLNPLVYEIRSDGKWAPAVSVACSKIADSIEEQGRWSDPEVEQIIEKHKRSEGEARLQLLKLLRFFRELLRTRKADAVMLERMSDALRSAFVSLPPFAVRGTAIYRTDDSGHIEQLCGNVGEPGRKYNLSANDDKPPDDPKRILVIDSYRENKIKINLYDDYLEKEYLLCYPVAKRYVITVHIIGHIEADEAIFQQMDLENRHLFNAINDLLGGEPE